MTWREALLGLILLIVAYMVWLLWRMRALNRKPAPSLRRVDREPSVVRTRAAAENPPLPRATTTRRPVSGEDAQRVAPEAEAEVAWSSETVSGMAQQAFMQGVERELAQVRDEVDALRGALAALREELGSLREDFLQETTAMRAAQNASPLYSDAMQMALQGHDAATIAERCGLSRAEADLVTALVRHRQPEDALVAGRLPG